MCVSLSGPVGVRGGEICCVFGCVYISVCERGFVTVCDCVSVCVCEFGCVYISVGEGVSVCVCV